MSHIGLLRAFEEEGIPIDLIVGSSMGSIIAGLYASGMSVDNLTQLVHTIDVTSLFDFRLPLRGSLLDAARFRRFLDEITDHADIADLPIPFYTVLTNLDTGEETTLHNGSLSRAIHASMAMPIIFPPVEVDGQYYVDGGTKNLVPANVVRDLGADLVIAVDVKKEVYINSRTDLLTNIRLFMQFMFRGYTDAKLPYADVLILPNVGNESYMDYNAVNHLIEEGYRAAKKDMPEIKRRLLAQDPDFSFTEHNPMPGLSAADFALKLQTALDSVYERHTGFSLKLDSLELPGPAFAISAAYSIEAGLPLFIGYKYVNRANPYVGFHTVSAGFGKEDATHLAAFMRKYTVEPDWHPGLDVRLDLAEWLQFDAELTAGAQMAPEWRVAATATYDPAPTAIAGKLQLSAGRNRSDATGLKSAAGYVAAASELRLPLAKKSLDVWEVAAIYPAWIIAGDAYASLDDCETLAGWRVQTGLDAEIRFFGISAVHTRLSAGYEDEYGDGAWSVRLRIGD